MVIVFNDDALREREPEYNDPSLRAAGELDSHHIHSCPHNHQNSTLYKIVLNKCLLNWINKFNSQFEYAENPKPPRF